MRYLIFLSSILFLGSLLTGCATNADPSATSNVAVTMSAATANGKTTVGGRVAVVSTLTEVKVNVRELSFDFDHMDNHFKMDSGYRDDKDSKLKGPFILDLLDVGTFVDQVIATVSIPNGKYEKISFKMSPSTVAGDMNGKSILIKGSIVSTPFEFWHNANAKFGSKFSDSTALATSGGAVNLAIHLELDKILSVTNGGVDLSKAKDGNNDGIITIDPINTDGNKDLADAIMKLLTRRTHCEKGKK